MNDINFKALVALDGHEMQLIIDSLMSKAYELTKQGKGYESATHIMVANKVQEEKKKFHALHEKRLGSIYGIKSKEKASYNPLT